MRRRVDDRPLPDVRLVRAQGGTKWGAFDHETQAFGLAAPGGTDPDTGIAGLTLGGGIGWLSGSYGLSCDNLISADVVTADGSMLTANADENPDLLSPDTGIAGLTLGGGIGWLSGSYGLSCDNLISADVVTADGSMLTANADENPDLL